MDVGLGDQTKIEVIPKKSFESSKKYFQFLQQRNSLPETWKDQTEKIDKSTVLEKITEILVNEHALQVRASATAIDVDLEQLVVLSYQGTFGFQILHL